MSLIWSWCRIADVFKDEVALQNMVRTITNAYMDTEAVLRSRVLLLTTDHHYDVFG